MQIKKVVNFYQIQLERLEGLVRDRTESLGQLKEDAFDEGVRVETFNF